MEHFDGRVPIERYHNEMMVHIRKQTELLEQIAQLLQPAETTNQVIAPVKRSYQRRKKA